MKRAFLLFAAIIASQTVFGQKLHGVESEYTVTYGYRYFFDEIDVATGNITQLTQLPIINYFADTYFTNCKGNSVFIAIDSSTTNPYHFNFYELDSFGNIVSIVPADTATFGRYNYVREAMDGSVYYALFLNTDLPMWETQMVSIDKQTGARTVMGSLTGTVYTSQMGSLSENLEPDNSIYSGGYAMTANGIYGYLYKMNLALGTVELLDSVQNAYYVNLHYDCNEDLTYGFVTDPNNMHLTGAQYFTIDQTEAVVPSGTIINGAGNSAYSWTEVLLPDGRYLLKTGPNLTIFDDDVTGAMYTPTNVAIPGNDVKLWMGPLMNCAAQELCQDETGIDESKPTTLTIYPSPNQTGEFYLSELISATFTVVNIEGSIVKEGELNVSKNINVGDLPVGLYFICIKNEHGIQQHRVVIN